MLIFPNWINPLLGQKQTPFCDRECTMFSMLDYNGSPTNPVYGRGHTSSLLVTNLHSITPPFLGPTVPYLDGPLWHLLYNDSRNGSVSVVCKYLGQNKVMDDRVQEHAKRCQKKPLLGQPSVHIHPSDPFPSAIASSLWFANLQTRFLS